MRPIVEGGTRFNRFLTFMSVCRISTFNAGRISLIVPTGGGGSLFLHKLTITQVTLRKKVIGISGLMKVKRGGTTPRLIT